MNHQGYGTFDRLRKIVLVHRAACALTNKSLDAGLLVRHKCDIRSCFNPLHLEVGTQADNHQDMMTRGRQAKGTAVHQAKLNETKVREIRDKARLGVSHRALAQKYGVSYGNIGLIVRRETWRHVA